MKKFLLTLLATVALALAAPATARATTCTVGGSYGSCTLFLGQTAPGISTIVLNGSMIGHFVTWSTTGLPTGVAVELDGSSDGGLSWVPLACAQGWNATGTACGAGTTSQTTGWLVAGNLWPRLRLNLTALQGGVSPLFNAQYYGNSYVNFAPAGPGGGGGGGVGPITPIVPLGGPSQNTTFQLAGTSPALATSGYNQYTLAYKTGNGLDTLAIQIEGSNDGSTWYQISGQGITPLTGGTLYASGSFIFVRVNLVSFVPNAGSTVNAILTTGMNGALNVQGVEQNGAPIVGFTLPICGADVNAACLWLPVARSNAAGVLPSRVLLVGGQDNTTGGKPQQITVVPTLGTVSGTAPVLIVGGTTSGVKSEPIPVAQDGGSINGFSIPAGGQDQNGVAEMLRTLVLAGTINTGTVENLDPSQMQPAAGAATCSFSYDSSHTCDVGAGSATGTGCSIQNATSCTFSADTWYRTTCTTDVATRWGASPQTPSTWDTPFWAKNVDVSVWVSAHFAVLAGPANATGSAGSCTVTQLTAAP